MSRIPDEVVQAVREATDLIEVASEHLALEKQGNLYVAKCFRNHGTPDFPRYDQTPSLTFMKDKESGEWRYSCFTCGLGKNEHDNDKGPANAFKFIQHYYRYTKNEELDFPTVMRMLGERAGIAVPPPVPPDPEIERLKQVATDRNRALWQNLVQDQGAMDYLVNERGLDVDDIRNPAFRLGLVTDSDPYNNSRCRIAFGVCEVTHNPATARTVGFQYRVRPGADCGAPDKKFVVDFETRVWKKGDHLYLLHAAVAEIRRRGYVHVVEGNFDAIWMHKVGYTNTVCTMGTALTAEMLAKLKRYTKKIIFWMEDEAGINALRSQLGTMLREGFEVLVVNTGGKDPDEICRRYGAQGVENYVRTRRKPAVQYILDEARARYDAIVYEAKAAALRDVMPVLGQITDPVARAVYLGQLGEVYGIAADELLPAPAPVPVHQNPPARIIRVGA